MMSRGSSGRQMKPGLGMGSADKARTNRDKHVGGGCPMPTGAVMGGGDQCRHKNAMSNSDVSPMAKNVQQ